MAFVAKPTKKITRYQIEFDIRMHYCPAKTSR